MNKMSGVINKTQHTDDDLRAILALAHHSLMHVTSKMVAMRIQCSVIIQSLQEVSSILGEICISMFIYLFNFMLQVGNKLYDATGIAVARDGYRKRNFTPLDSQEANLNFW